MAPTISFIVPAFNEAQLLGQTLAALHEAGRATGELYEIVVVNDGSTDDTGGIARAACARVVDVHVRQISRARNAGARAASGELFIFVDADTLVPAAAVRATVAAVRGGAAGGGAGVALSGRLPVWARLLMPVLRILFRASKLAAGCYVFSTREAFAVTGGFDERLFAAEEIAFSRALRRHGRMVILRECVVSSGRKVRTHSPRELLSTCAGVLRHGIGFIQTRQNLGLWYADRRHDPDVLG